VWLWRVADGNLVRELTLTTDFTSNIHSVAISPDGTLLAAADQYVRLWCVDDGKLLHSTLWESSRAERVAFSPDGTLVAGFDDKTVRLWHAPDMMLVRELVHLNELRSVAFSPDGKVVASSSRDKAVLLWSLK
jgi:WD40 repeat protein